MPSENIGDMQFWCDNDVRGIVILQGRIVSNGQRNTSEIISDVEKIAQRKSDILIKGVQLTTLNLDKCSVHIKHLGDGPDCVNSAPRHLTKWQSTGIAVSILSLFATFIAVLVFAFACFGRTRR